MILINEIQETSIYLSRKVFIKKRLFRVVNEIFTTNKISYLCQILTVLQINLFVSEDFHSKVNLNVSSNVILEDLRGS